MANVIVNSSTVNVTVVSSLLLGNGSPYAPSTHVVQLTGTSLVGLSLTVKGRPTNSAMAYVAIPYVRRSLAGVAQDDTPVVAALTGDFLIKIDSAGLDIMLDVTALTSGSALIGYRIVSGADA